MSEKSKKPRVLVLAAGGKKYGDGATGFEVMVRNTRTNPCVLDAEIVGAVSKYENGGTRQKCNDLEIPFEFRAGNFTAEWYLHLVEKYKADYVMCSGWLNYVLGINPAICLNVHPGLFPWTKGLHGDAVHLRALELFRKGEVVNTGVTMHFVTWKEDDVKKEEYDNGPVIGQHSVWMKDDDDLASVKARVNAAEHVLQSKILDLVVHKRIYYHNGKVHVQDHELKRFLGMN